MSAKGTSRIGQRAEVRLEDGETAATEALPVTRPRHPEHLAVPHEEREGREGVC